jgi:predicted alpha/beta-hydrolase family hydrolase
MTTKTSDRADLSFSVNESVPVSAILERPRDAQFILVFAHGAGAGMEHPFLESLTRELGAVGIATFRYQFPYMEQNRRVPDLPKVLTATVRAAVAKASELCPNLMLLAGGKSMGGRMTSTAAAESPIARVRGIVFVGFPLHPPKKPSTQRADHLKKVAIPMLFLQGTRDTLADLKLLLPICDDLGELASLRVIDDADHSFHVLRRSGKSDAEILRVLARDILEWANTLKFDGK